MTQARGYHPRARTVGEDAEPAATRLAAQRRTPLAAAPRPSLRLVTPERGTDRGTRASADRASGAGRAAGAGRVAGADRAASAADRAAAARAARGHTWAGQTGGFATYRPGAARPASRGRLGEKRMRRVTTPPPAPPLASSGGRLRQITAIIALLFAVIAGRLVEFQFRDAPAIAAEGLEFRLQPVHLPAPRGSILDRNGAVLAGSAEARYVFADPSRVEDAGAAADALSLVLGVPRSDLLPKLVPHVRDDGTEVLFEFLARGVSVAIGESVRELGLPGIGVRRDETRVVPGHDLAANLIGFTGRDLQGLAGLEESYESILAGVDGYARYEVGQGVANLDQVIPGGYHEEVPARPGRSLQLTIDRDLQFEIQRILAEEMSRVGAFNGSAVVLDVRTGEVLAQASYPFYDAANPLASQPGDRGDMASGMLVDPGSVHKAIVFAACLQEGVIGPDDTVPLPLQITKGVTTFDDSHAHPSMASFTLPGLLAWSSNVGAITLADRLGAQKLYEYQRAFGLGEPIGEGLPGEAAGLVQPPENWSADAYGTIPIGMGVSVTPLQMAAVYATIANGGVYIRPHLVKAIIDADQNRQPMPAPVTRQVISAETATALRTMLEAVVVAPQATGGLAAIDDYRVAGKTGTGSLVINGAYANGEVGSFIGMAPADAPRYVIAVFAHTPGGGGGTVAAPAFSRMMEQTLLHYRVAPTGTRPPTFTIYQG